jgi:hypothetical protein
MMSCFMMSCTRMGSLPANKGDTRGIQLHFAGRNQQQTGFAISFVSSASLIARFRGLANILMLTILGERIAFLFRSWAWGAGAAIHGGARF